MMRTKFFLSILFLFSFSLAALAQQSKEDLEKKRDDLMKEIELLQKELNQTKSSKSANLTQLATLQKKIKAREKVINSYNAEIGQLNRDISNKAAAVRSLDKDLDELKKNYANMVYYAYKHRSAYDHLIFLFSAQSFNDAFQRLKYIKRYNAYRRQQAELITTTQLDLKKQMSSLRSRKQNRQKLVNEQLQQKKKLTTEKSEKDKMVKSLSKQEKDLKAKIEKKKKEQAKLKAEIAGLIKKEIEAAKKKAAASGTTAGTSGSSSLALTPEAAALSSGFANNQGKLPWPVTKGEIREQFGTHAHDVFDNLTVKNNGIDIKTAPNADVRAIFKGTVVGILSNPGYHKAVLVRHGEYFTVYSNLASVKVKANQEIDTKQSVGTAYTEPGAGESIVHLEIWKGTTLLNPEDWIAGR
jgi:septal ring factor EnvC (AmiA/AmiB activator)